MVIERFIVENVRRWGCWEWEEIKDYYFEGKGWFWFYYLLWFFSLSLGCGFWGFGRMGRVVVVGYGVVVEWEVCGVLEMCGVGLWDLELF